MEKIRKNWRNGIVITICFAASMMISGCDPSELTTTGELTELTSPITENTRLKDLGLPVDYVYKGSGLLEVKNNAILTIEDGVTIQFTHANGGIEIGDGATIKALGTADKPIQFIGGVTKGSWNGVYIKTKKENQLHYVDMMNGGSRTDDFNNAAVLNIEEGKAGISHCKISGGKVYGIALWDNFTLTAFDNNKIENCDSEPVWFRGQFSRLDKFDVTSDFTNNAKPYIHVWVPQFSTETANLNETSVPYYFAGGGMDYLDADLTIGAGVTIYMGEATGFGTGQDHKGKLNINGTVAKPVLFTRVPMNYHWKAIHLAGSSHKIKNCILEYGGNSWNGWEDAGILNVAFTVNIEFENVTVRNSINYGIHILHFDDCSYSGGNTVTFQSNAGGNVRVFGKECDTGCVFSALP